MPNTINGTITVNIKVPGFSNAAARRAISGGTSASRSVGPSGWWNRTGLSSAELNYENMMKRQFLAQQNLMKKNQKEEETARKERLKLGGIPEGLYSKFNPEDALNYDKIQAKETQGMKKEAELANKIGIKEGIFSGPAFKAMAKFLPIIGGVSGIIAVAQNSKLLNTITSTTMELLGTLVDVILLPLMPLLLPLLKGLAWIIQQTMEFFKDPGAYLEKIWGNFIKWLTIEWLKIVLAIKQWIPGNQGEQALINKIKELEGNPPIMGEPGKPITPLGKLGEAGEGLITAFTTADMTSPEFREGSKKFWGNIIEIIKEGAAVGGLAPWVKPPLKETNINVEVNISGNGTPWENFNKDMSKLIDDLEKRVG